VRAPIRICIQVQVATSGPDSARACRHAQRRRPSARASRPSSKNCLCWAPRPARGPQPQAPQPTCVCRKKSQVTRRTHDRALASQLGRSKTCIIKTASSGTLGAACPPRPGPAGRPRQATYETLLSLKHSAAQRARAQNLAGPRITLPATPAWQNHRPAARPRRAPMGRPGRLQAPCAAARAAPKPTSHKPPKAQDQSLSCAVAPGRRPCLHNLDAPARRASGPAAATLLGNGRAAPPLRAHFVPATGQQGGRRAETTPAANRLAQSRAQVGHGWELSPRRERAPRLFYPYILSQAARLRAVRSRARAPHAKSGAGRPAAAAAFIAATSSLVAKRPLMRGRTSAYALRL